MRNRRKLLCDCSFFLLQANAATLNIRYGSSTLATICRMSGCCPAETVARSCDILLLSTKCTICRPATTAENVSERRIWLLKQNGCTLALVVKCTVYSWVPWHSYVIWWLLSLDCYSSGKNVVNLWPMGTKSDVFVGPRNSVQTHFYHWLANSWYVVLRVGIRSTSLSS